MSAARSGKRSGARQAGRLTVTQVKSAIGYNQRQRATLRGLGLRRLRHSVELEATPAVRGMIDKVRHLVTVVEG